MCYHCYQGMDKETIMDQLKDALHRQDYPAFNGTSVNMLKIIIADKTHDEEMKDLARKVLEEYHAWKNTQ